MSVERLRVPADQLTVVCDPDELGFETTSALSPLEGTIGQDRAESALGLALDIDAEGFNLLISGVPGSGRNTALKAHLEQIAESKPVPPDWGYVHNFDDPSQPLAICLPCGMMRVLQRDMNELVEACRREIPAIFESDDYTRRTEEVMQEFQNRRQQITGELEQEAQRLGFTLSFTQTGITPVPMTDGWQMTQEEFTNLSDEVREELRGRAEQLQRSITHFAQEMRRLGKEATEREREADAELVRFTLTPIVDELQEKYGEFPKVVDYLNRVEADIVEHLEVFKPREETLTPFSGLAGQPRDEDVFLRYRVNDLVDNTNCQGAPIVFEYNPTYYNLFGRIDYRARMGALTTDLTMIRPGALHRANGGYLVLQARDLLISPMSWESLKRSLHSGQVRVENIGEQYSPLPSATLRPEPIPISAKIVLVGNPNLMRSLRIADEDVPRYFKVTADFDTVMDRTPENMSSYAAFVASQSRRNGLKPFHKTAVGRIVDYSSRLVEDQTKLTTRFMDVADMLTEANYWAGKDGSDVVRGEHVKKAIEQRDYRLSLTEDRIQELIKEGTIHIDTEGQRVGQVNGLAVYSLGDYTFGKPSRITARVSLGRGQLVNIEREAQMGSKIHNKGFIILNGYLQGKYGQERPLSLSASIGFEQTYSEVEGDSASSTELYTLLSELSGLPLDQGIAVTGSVNQAGEVQAIGGATHKIEGFYEVCKDRGLNGKQGVMVPRDNLKNLVLKDEVVQAVRDGRFHIYAVSTIDEGIQVLTGMPAGERQEDGMYPEGTVNYLVEKRLDEMAQKAREYGRSNDRNNGASKKPEEAEPEEKKESEV
jgi:lon-related putative ATP-dependent protease